MQFFHGTSDALPINRTLLPPASTDVQRENWRTKLTDKVFVTNSVKSATMYAKKACKKYGGNPIVYQVQPKGYIYQTNNTEFVCDSAIIRKNIVSITHH